MSEWTPTDRQVEWFFDRGCGEQYSLTADPMLENPREAFQRWLREHDRRLTEASHNDFHDKEAQ